MRFRVETLMIYLCFSFVFTSLMQQGFEECMLHLYKEESMHQVTRHPDSSPDTFYTKCPGILECSF
jgi:hypothetical protein